jgi:hypothetical protein
MLVEVWLRRNEQIPMQERCRWRTEEVSRQRLAAIAYRRLPK